MLSSNSRPLSSLEADKLGHSIMEIVIFGVSNGRNMSLAKISSSTTDNQMDFVLFIHRNDRRASSVTIPVVI